MKPRSVQIPRQAVTQRIASGAAALALVIVLLAWPGSRQPAAQGHALGVNEAHLPASLPGEPITLEDYLLLVDNTYQLAVQAGGMIPAEQRDAFLKAAQDWQSFATVSLPDGSRVPVQNSAIIAELQRNPPDPQRLQARLEELLRQYHAWPDGEASPDDLQKLARILAEPQYQWEEDSGPSPLEVWLKQQIQRFVEWLLNALGERITYETLIIGRYALIGVGVLVVVLVLGYTLRGLRRSIASEAELAVFSEAEEGLSASAARQKAQQMSASGDYRMGVRYLYLSALLELEERGLLRYDRTKTNREYLRSVMQSPGLFASLNQVVEVFDRVWYGFQPLDDEAYQRYASQIARLREEK